MSNTLTEVLEQQAQTPAEETITSYHETLVGENKKFADDELLAKSYHNANMHIEELKADNDALRQNGELLKEVLAELRNDPAVEAGNEPVAPTSAAPAQSLESHVVTDDIAKIVDQHISSRDQAATAKANTDKTMELLTEKYGNAGAALKAVNDVVNGNDGVKQSLDALSTSDPAAAVRFITNVVTPPANPAPNTPGVGGNGSAEMLVASQGGLTWAQCCQLRREDPKQYASPDFRLKMEQAVAAAEARGVDFFAT